MSVVTQKEAELACFCQKEAEFVYFNQKEAEFVGFCQVKVETGEFWDDEWEFKAATRRQYQEAEDTVFDMLWKWGCLSLASCCTDIWSVIDFKVILVHM